MTKHATTLQDRLARSLDQANVREKKEHRQAPAIPAAAPDERRCTKLSVSLFAGDLARLNSIRDYMATRGHRISTSQAVKLALRTAALDVGMEEALDVIRGEDGRKW
jgi:hypothetical protein